MRRNDTSEVEGTEPEPRDVRAASEAMIVVPHGGGSGLFDVYSGETGQYVVDLRERVCSCPDHARRGVLCKHQRRVMMGLGLRDVPAGVRPDPSLERTRAKYGVDGIGGVEADEPEPATAIATDGGRP